MWVERGLASKPGESGPGSDPMLCSQELRGTFALQRERRGHISVFFKVAHLLGTVELVAWAESDYLKRSSLHLEEKILFYQP